MGSSHGWIKCRAYQLGIELRKTRLTRVVEDKYGIDHDAEKAGFQPFSSIMLSRRMLEYGSMSSEDSQVHYDCFRYICREEAYSP